MRTRRSAGFTRSLGAESQSAIRGPTIARGTFTASSAVIHTHHSFPASAKLPAFRSVPLPTPPRHPSTHSRLVQKEESNSLMLLVNTTHQGGRRRQDVVDKDEDGLFRGELDAFTDDIDELADS